MKSFILVRREQDPVSYEMSYHAVKVFDCIADANLALRQKMIELLDQYDNLVIVHKNSFTACFTGKNNLDTFVDFYIKEVSL